MGKWTPSLSKRTRNASHGISLHEHQKLFKNITSFPSSTIQAYLLIDGVHAYLLINGLQNVSNKSSIGLSRNVLVQLTMIRMFLLFPSPICNSFQNAALKSSGWILLTVLKNFKSILQPFSITGVCTALTGMLINHFHVGLSWATNFFAYRLHLLGIFK